jgi:hypothetical protein
MPQKHIVKRQNSITFFTHFVHVNMKKNLKSKSKKREILITALAAQSAPKQSFLPQQGS